jgi:50S ribosomal subunit-associated GTPase HflX
VVLLVFDLSDLATFK